MFGTPRSKTPVANDAGGAAPERESAVLSLDAIERVIGGGAGTKPSEVTMLRGTARALRIMAGAGGEFATLVCVPGPGGIRIAQGQASLQVARELRAKAAWRGDLNWSEMMGRNLRFRIVYAAADAAAGRGGRTPKKDVAGRGGRGGRAMLGAGLRAGLRAATA